MTEKRFNARRWHLGTVRQWHWISSALCLVGMLLFAITGITLNHAGIIPSTPDITVVEGQVPAALLDGLADSGADKAPLPEALLDWLARQKNLHIPASAQAEWSEDEIYLGLPGPGSDAWLSLDLASGELFYERTERGWIAYLNDLHKGRNTGAAWRWFIDVFAIACVVFCLSGLLLLQRQTMRRPGTWPVVGLGLVIPLLLVILFIH